MNTTPEGFVKAYEAALATQQWAQVAPLLVPYVCVTFSDGTVYKGIAEVEQAYTRNFNLIKDEHFVISEVHWVKVDSRFAVYTFVFSWTGLIAGKPASGNGHGTATLICEEGKWLLLTEHLGK